MMKRTICIILALILAAAFSVTAFGANLDTVGGSSSAEVKAKFNSTAPEDVYSVTLSWGAMEFDYTAQGEKWDDETHKWVPDDSRPATWTVKDSGNTVTLVNDSSTAISAAFAFAPNSSYTGLSGSFTYNSAALSAPLALEKPLEDKTAKNYTVTFMPVGTIPATHSETSYAKMGTITVTLN